MQVNASVFKAYDIRGIVGKTHRRRLRRAPRPRLRQRGAAAGRDRRSRSAATAALSGPALVARADPRPGVDRARRRRHRRGDHADALLRRRDARRARLPAAASRSPAATTRRTTTASRWCSPAARSTARRSRPAPAHRGRGLRAAARAASATMDILAEYIAAHRRRLQARAADEDRRRLAATARRRVGARASCARSAAT